VDDEQKPKHGPRFWPLVFLVAFVLGASLWAVWMVHLIRKTRAERTENIFVPAASTNSAITNSR
jgi:hypothetical protein